MHAIATLLQHATLRFFLMAGLTTGLTAGLLAGGGAAQAAELIAEGARPQVLASEFTFTEGPAADEAGNVYFTDIPNNRIHVWSTDGQLSTFRENSNATNGLFFDANWQLYGA